MPTDYGFTGQHSDSATGLDYYGARYYDPVAQQFTSADTLLPGNGMSPWNLSRYAYVQGNPLIRVDPTGHDGGWLGGLVSSVTSTVSSAASTVASVAQAAAPAAVGVLDATTGIPSMINDVQTIFSGNASILDKVMAGADLLINVAMDVSMVVGVGEGLRAAYVGAKIASHVAVDVGEHALAHAGEDAVEHVAEHEAEDVAEHTAEDVGASCAMSFAASTLVLTPTGARAIAALKVGQRVIAYNPATHTSSPQTVTATSIHHDSNLVDVTLRVTTPAPAAHPAGKASATATNATTAHTEVVHTTANHPWLSADHGWLIASFLHVGEPVRQADGGTAVVVGVRSVAGAADMWDLTIASVHTFAVGSGAFVVHNCATPAPSYEDDVKAANGDSTIGENNSHRWDGSQPVTDANGNPGDRGWSGPDAVRDYGAANETWIEAKSNVTPGADLFSNDVVDRNFRQLATYERYGRPFEYWLDALPSADSVDLIESAGGRVRVF